MELSSPFSLKHRRLIDGKLCHCVQVIEVEYSTENGHLEFSEPMEFGAGEYMLMQLEQGKGWASKWIPS